MFNYDNEISFEELNIPELEEDILTVGIIRILPEEVKWFDEHIPENYLELSEKEKKNLKDSLRDEYYEWKKETFSEL